MVENKKICIIKAKKNAVQSIIFIAKKNVKNISLSSIDWSYECKAIRIKYPNDLDIKNVCTPNIKMPTRPLNKETYFAPLIPNDVLNKTGKGIP